MALELLSSAGAQVFVAEDGRRAIETLEENPVDVVLMDCQMPVLDGYGAAHEIRGRPEWTDLPIIAKTANVMSSQRHQAEAAGMNDNIDTPIDVDARYEKIVHWARRPVRVSSQ